MLIPDRNRRAVTMPGDLIFYPGSHLSPPPVGASYTWAGMSLGATVFTAPRTGTKAVLGLDTNTGAHFPDSLIPLLGAGLVGTVYTLTDTDVASVAGVEGRANTVFSTSSPDSENPGGQSLGMTQSAKITASSEQVTGLQLVRASGDSVPSLTVQWSANMTGTSGVIVGIGDFLRLGSLDNGDLRIEARLTRDAGGLRYGLVMTDAAGFVYASTLSATGLVGGYNAFTLHHAPSSSLADTAGGRTALWLTKPGIARELVVDYVGGTRATSSTDSTQVALHLGNNSGALQRVTLPACSYIGLPSTFYASKLALSAEAPGVLRHTQYGDGSILYNYPPSIVNSFGRAAITGLDSAGHGASTANADFDVVGGTPACIVEHILDPLGLNDSTAPGVKSIIDAQQPLTFAASTAPGGIGKQYSAQRLLRVDPAWTGRNPQNTVTLEFANNKQTPRRLYFTHKFRTPSNLTELMTRGDGYAAWLELFAWKSNDSIINDSRLSSTLLKYAGDSGIRYNLQFDNCGTDFTTGVNNGIIIPFWLDRTAPGAIVPARWYKLEVDFKRADKGKRDSTTGFCTAILTDLVTGVRTPITRRYGSQQLLPVDEDLHPTLATLSSYKPGVYWGHYEYPFTRFMHPLAYSGGKADPDVFEQLTSDTEFWAAPPMGLY